MLSDFGHNIQYPVFYIALPDYYIFVYFFFVFIDIFICIQTDIFTRQKLIFEQTEMFFFMHSQQAIYFNVMDEFHLQ